MGKCIVSPEYWGKISISTHSFERKKQKQKQSMLLRLLSNVLGVLDRLLHLIENKIYEEIVVNIPIYLMRRADSSQKTLMLGKIEGGEVDNRG